MMMAQLIIEALREFSLRNINQWSKHLRWGSARLRKTEQVYFRLTKKAIWELEALLEWT